MSKVMQFDFCKVIEWIDGDTVDLDIDLGFGIVKRERCRLWGVNAPEMKGETLAKGRDARFLMIKKSVDCGNVVMARTRKDKDKFGRYLAELIGVDYSGINVNFGEELLRAALAVEFMR